MSTPTEPLPDVRHYITLIEGAHAYAKLTPRQADSFAKLGPNDPIDIGGDGNRWYPVSAAIAEEWTADAEVGD